MSDYCIPLDIQEEIIKRLPVKSMIRFTSVSKQWKSLICNSEFISDYHICNIQPHHLLISYEKHNDGQEYYLSVVDDDTFPKQKFSLTLPTSPHDKPSLIDSSQGMLCFSYYTCNYKNRQDSKFKMIVVIWNPTIRKSVDIVVPNVLDIIYYDIVVGFGVLLHTGDPMLVKIKCIKDIGKTVTATDIPWRVEVFTLSLGAWRSPSINLPRKSVELTNNQVVINRFIYWLTYDRYFVDGELDSHSIIMSFDMTSEEFTEAHLPDSFRSRKYRVSISKLRDSLVVVENRYSSSVNIWTMHNGDPKSLAMIFTINTPGKPAQPFLSLTRAKR
ncbi:F-box/kelch-repeat protein-like protein [Tanacetum coccineum]|uniref:F-box/kelch-repeat protein-like protein n=1 Tax=Tanacetum coccineum TaxID=301880 RepID=A0ABQ5ASR6_9ASTR